MKTANKLSNEDIKILSYFNKQNLFELNWQEWIQISRYYDGVFSDDFLIDNKENIVWDYLCIWHFLSERVLMECIDKIKWDVYFRWLRYQKFENIYYQMLFNKFLDKIDWFYISMHNLPENILDNYFDKIEWEIMFRHNNSINEKFVEKYHKFLTYDQKKYLLRSLALPRDTIDIFEKVFGKEIKKY